MMKFKLGRDKLVNQKRMYKFLIAIMIVSMIFGFIFPFFLDQENSNVLSTSITTFFNNINNGEIDYTNGFINTFISNSCYVLAIWLLGISIIGSIFVLLNCSYQAFAFGFSISSIIKIYGIKGIIGSITYIFPGQIFGLIITLLLTFYSISFTIKLFKYLFLKENLNFKMIMNRYVKILLICYVSYVVITISDVYLAPLLMKLFTMIV